VTAPLPCPRLVHTFVPAEIVSGPAAKTAMTARESKLQFFGSTLCDFIVRLLVSAKEERKNKTIREGR
jgi:hypothetical protein